MKRMFTLSQLNEAEKAYVDFKEKNDLASYKVIRKLSSGVIKSLGESSLSSQDKTDIMDFGITISLNKYDPANQETEGFFMDKLYSSIKNEIDNLKKEKEKLASEELIDEIDEVIELFGRIGTTIGIDVVDTTDVLNKLFESRFRRTDDVVELIKNDVTPEALIKVIMGSIDQIDKIKDTIEMNKLKRSSLIPLFTDDFDGEVLGRFVVGGLELNEEMPVSNILSILNLIK